MASMNVELMNDFYFLGLSFDPTETTTPSNENVLINITGINCTNNQIFVNMCQDPSTLPMQGDFTDKHQVYARFTVPQLTINVTFSGSLSAGTLDIMANPGYAPVYSPMALEEEMKEEVPAPVKISYPQSGDWFILYSLSNPGTTNTTFTLDMPTTTSCPAGMTGLNCSYSLLNITTSQSNPAPLNRYTLSNGTWNYYVVTAGSSLDTSLWVTVAPDTSSGASLNDFHVYVKRGALPDINNYDILDCNTNQCQYARIINLNNTVTPNIFQNYYIGIRASVPTSFGIWWSSTCSPRCVNDDESGECSFSGNVGQCICADGYTGFDCTTPTGILPTQYIVLIIIASLVVLSALIGFFAWAYMQRKRDGYSTLT